MQRARASVVVETIGGVGLLLRLHYDGAWSQRMHRATGHVNHLALINIDPVEQLFRALVMDGLLELSQSNAGLQVQGDLRSRLGMGHVPAFGFAPGLAEALSGGVVGVHLDRELFLGKQKLQKQRKAPWVGRGVPTSSEPNSLLRSRSDRFASGPFATKQLSPVSQASPILSLNL